MSSTPRAAVRHAVIPCGGRNASMRSLTDGGAVGGAVEVLPIAGVPMIEWVVRECAASGTSDLLIVTRSDTIRERVAPRAGTPGFPLRIEFASYTGTPGTLADALAVARTFAGDPLAPIGVAIPTNLFIGDAPGLAQVVESYYRSGHSVVGIVGDAAGDEIDLAPTLPAMAGMIGMVGRYLIGPSAWDVLQAHPTARDDRAVLRALLEANALIGRRMRGQFLDMGSPSGYTAANRATIRPPRHSAPTGRIE